MPRGFFRLLAVLLLALTIPVQGIAAVTNAQCMAFGHHEDSAGHEHHAHAHGGAGQHDAGGASHGNDGGKKPHCGPCAACCATAVAPASTHPASLESRSSLPSATPSAPASFSLDTPERPPLAG